MCSKKLFYNARACTAIQCNDLNMPTFENGMVTYAEDNAAPFDLDTIATYECHDGFFLNGEAERHCTVGEGRSSGLGMWNGVAPTCVRKLINQRPCRGRRVVVVCWFVYSFVCDI